MSELDARMFELEGVLLEAQSLAANAESSEPPGPCRDELRDRLMVPIELALHNARALQKDPWSL